MVIAMLLAAAVGAPAGIPPQSAESLGRTVYFAVNGTRLDGRARAVLDALAGWLLANPAASATIEGHADARGSRSHNRALARRRAAAVRAWLVARGIAPGRLFVIGFGEERPALYDYGESVWMMNRRVEVRINR